nr:(Na+)-NQR maturation NqrM [Providencia rustigianii]
MLNVFLATFALFLLAFLGMSLGYIIKRKSIQGSCGGLSSIGVEKVCDCPEPCDARKKRMAREEARKKMLEKNRIIWFLNWLFYLQP